MIRPFFRDLRSALRDARRHPAFALSVILTLGLAIGANTAIFTVVRAVLMRQLPFAQPDRLVVVNEREPGSDRQPFSIADFLDLQGQSRTFETLVGWGGWNANWAGVEETVALKAQWTSGGFFEALGVRAALGRTPLPEEERAGAPRVALLSDGLWKKYFGADPGVLGRALTINGEPFAVIGVLPPEFVFLTPGAELVSPLALEGDPRRAKRGAAFVRIIGRLRAATGLAAAVGDLDAIFARLRLAYPDTNGNKLGVKIEPLAEVVVGSYRRTLLVLQAAVGLVLLIACTNLASLLLARLAGRRSELALRSALGASRGDLARQLLCETAVLGLAGGAIGLAVARAGVRAFLEFGPAQLPRASEIVCDWPVLAFNLGVSILAGLGLGLVPALQGSRRGFAEAMQAGGRGSTGDRRAGPARSMLVAVEVGLSLVLLVGAGLLLRTLHRLQATDPGFQPDRLLAVQLSLPRRRYGNPAAIAQYADQVTERLARLPGVVDIGASSLNPLTAWRASVNLTIEGRADQDRRKATVVNYRAVGPGYLKALGVPLLSGRDVEARDGPEGVPIALVSETLARRHFPAASPLGARLQIDDLEPWRTVEVVGVVGDVKHTGLDAEGTADVYIPYAQTPQGVSVWLANIFCLAVRTSGDPRLVISSIRREIRALDPDVATSSMRTMDEALSGSLSDRRFSTVLLGMFGAAALLLALAGIYSVAAFAVVERTREIGVRLSLGSSRMAILGLVARQSLRPVGVGLLLGLAAALALGRLLSGLLFGVAANDAGTLAAAAAALGVTACLASVLPALRATRVDPVRALRAD